MIFLIVSGLLSVIKAILKALLSSVNIPSLDSFDDLLMIINNALSYGASLVRFALPVGSTILVLLPVVLAIHYFDEIYAFGIWLYNKIPFIH